MYLWRNVNTSMRSDNANVNVDAIVLELVNGVWISILFFGEGMLPWWIHDHRYRIAILSPIRRYEGGGVVYSYV